MRENQLIVSDYTELVTICHSVLSKFLFTVGLKSKTPVVVTHQKNGRCSLNFWSAVKPNKQVKNFPYKEKLKEKKRAPHVFL